METLNEKIISKKEKTCIINKNKDFILLESQNTNFLFKIKINIYSKNSVPEELKQNMSEFQMLSEKVMIIQAELDNKDEPFFFDNNQELNVPEKYYEILSLIELQNMISDSNWFNELSDFKDVFLKGINNNNYELLASKTNLLLFVEIENIFGFRRKCFFILKPFEHKINENSTKNNIDFSNINQNREKDNNSISSNARVLRNKLSNKKDNLIRIFLDNNNNSKKKIKDKKRLRTRYISNKNSSDNRNNSPTNNSSRNNNCENENNNNKIDNLIENLNKNMVTKLPPFEADALIRESNILKGVEEELLIGEMLSNLKFKKYRLLFRATRDGDSANKFHSFCDNYSNLLILIETQKGRRFGGFTSSKFKSNSHMKYDNNAFLFSLDLKKVYKIMPGNYAIYCYENSGPSFSKGSLHIPNHFFKKPGKTSMIGGPFQFEKNYELNNGEEKFIVNELEVFQVKIED